MPNSYLLAVIQLAILTAVTIPVLVLFLSMKREARAAIAQCRQESADNMEKLNGLARQLEAIQADQRQNKLRQQEQPANVVIGAAMNLSKRGQVMRLHRLGSDAEQIASALRLPRNEVSLLLKIHAVAMGGRDLEPASPSACLQFGERAVRLPAFQAESHPTAP